MTPAALARAWLGAPAVRDPQAERAALVLAHRAVSGVPWRPVPLDPYASAEEMAQRFAHDRVLLVFDGGHDGAPWSRDANLVSRVAHDMDHVRYGYGFGLAGEHAAARHAAARAPGLAWLYASEVLGQAAAATVTGGFAPQKIVRSGLLTRALREEIRV